MKKMSSHKACPVPCFICRSGHRFASAQTQISTAAVQSCHKVLMPSLSSGDQHCGLKCRPCKHAVLCLPLAAQPLAAQLESPKTNIRWGIKHSLRYILPFVLGNEE